MTLSGVNSTTNNTSICCLIFLVYEDYKSIYYILKYLNEFFGFEPRIINIDFDKAERKALSMENLFKEKPLIISCFFHFTQAIIKNMKKYQIIKKRLSKTIIELLRNIQMMCFINPILLKQFSEILKKK